MSVAAFRAVKLVRDVRRGIDGAERSWNESNCYIDVWIEVLHALSLDPMPCMPFTLAIDFEGDQWTFFKPPHKDLYALYGIDVQELNVWRPLIHHAEEQLRGGKLVLTEADAFFLPDTQGTDYRTQHTKTTIAIQEIDVEARRLCYFHNGGYYGLEGADFAGIFRLDVPHDPAFLPLFAELVRLDRVRRLSEEELTKATIALVRENLARRPKTNPVRRFAERLVVDVDWLKGEGLATYHVYAFATLRQLGASFEIAARLLRWLEARGEGDLEATAKDFDTISSTAKALILKTARAVSSKKPADLAPMTTAIAESWDRGMERLVSRLDG
jgi:hypothetical protein